IVCNWRIWRRTQVMMNRRKALLGVGAAAIAGVATAKLAVATMFQAAPAKDNGQTDVDGRLRNDLDRLKPREYSEAGVPVFLACEDLVEEKSSKNAKLTPFNATVASELRSNAAAWQRLKPDAPDMDVAKVIEVLADRDFNRGGTEEPVPKTAPTFHD